MYLACIQKCGSISNLKKMLLSYNCLLNMCTLKWKVETWLFLWHVSFTNIFKMINFLIESHPIFRNVWPFLKHRVGWHKIISRHKASAFFKAPHRVLEVHFWQTSYLKSKWALKREKTNIYLTNFTFIEFSTLKSSLMNSELAFIDQLYSRMTSLVQE